MTDEELQNLAANIRQNGLLHPIVLYQNHILDGRNRYLACGIANIEPRFVEWRGKGSPLQWVISENMVRRHLTSSQRAVLALELLPLLEEEAHQRKRLSPGRGGKNTRKNFRVFSTENGNGEARQIDVEGRRRADSAIEDDLRRGHVTLLGLLKQPLDDGFDVLRRDGVYQGNADRLDLLCERITWPTAVSLGPSAICVASVSAVL